MLRLALLPLCLLLACSGNDVAAPGTAAKSPAAAPVTVSSVSEPTEKTPASVVKPPTLVAPSSGASGPNSVVSGPVPGPIDPKWLRVDLFPGATVASSGRTAPDAEGLFSTQLLLALPDGTTRDTCISTVSDAVASTVPKLERKDGENRVTLSGSNDDYAITVVCGEAKGKMSAYLSYRWLRPPKTP